MFLPIIFQNFNIFIRQGNKWVLLVCFLWFHCPNGLDLDSHGRGNVSVSNENVSVCSRVSWMKAQFRAHNLWLWGRALRKNGCRRGTVDELMRSGRLWAATTEPCQNKASSICKKRRIIQMCWFFNSNISICDWITVWKTIMALGCKLFWLRRLSLWMFYSSSVISTTTKKVLHIKWVC